MVQSYPNLGLVTESGDRSVILSHGHFIEPLYRMMSLLDTVFGSPRSGAVEAWQLEADNGGWIDFFWSSMGDSGDIMRVTRSLYESLQSTETIHAEISAIERAIKVAGASRARADVEAHAVAGLLRAGVGTAVRERHREGIILSPHADQGLASYLDGPVVTQVGAEIGAPRDVTFVFGHTHKPFVDVRTHHPVPVSGLGGQHRWLGRRHPAAQSHEGSVGDPHRRGAQRGLRPLLPRGTPTPPPTGSASSPARPADSNPLVDQLRSAVDPGRDPWASLAQAIRTTVGDRGRQLDERLRSDASTLNQLNRVDQGNRVDRGGPSPAPPGPASGLTKAARSGA